MNISMLYPLGWLVFALGVGLILISLVHRKEQVRSRTRRAAGALSGAVFCMVAAIVIVPDISGTAQDTLLISAVIFTFVSLYLARHGRKLDRQARRGWSR